MINKNPLMRPDFSKVLSEHFGQKEMEQNHINSHNQRFL